MTWDDLVAGWRSGRCPRCKCLAWVRRQGHYGHFVIAPHSSPYSILCPVYGDQYNTSRPSPSVGDYWHVLVE